MPGAQRLNRAGPALPADRYQTFQVASPVSTHFRAATCEEVGCPEFLNGWTTRLDVATQGALIQAVRDSGRPPSAVITEGGAISFVFEAGTACFKATEHVVRLDRPEIFVTRRGDWRRSHSPRRYDRGDQWVDDFATNQDRLATLLQRG